MNCPRCGSPKLVKNCPTNRDRQNFKCRYCHRQFVQNPRHQKISEDTQKLIDQLLLEKYLEPGLSKSPGCRPAGWNTMYFQQLASVPGQFQVKSKKTGKITIECDEMSWFVGYKGNKQWKELAIDALTKEILGV